MTRQEIFETVARHLFRQGVQAIGELPEADQILYKGIEGCAYRGKNGTKCAAGCLIPDELYKPEFENKTVSGLVKLDAAELPEFFTTELQLIACLQTVHDDDGNWKSSDTMRAELADVGRYHQLSIDFLSELSFDGR